MNELLPIIRRVRRPLLPVESVPDGPPAPPVHASGQNEDGGLKMEDGGAADQVEPSSTSTTDTAEPKQTNDAEISDSSAR